MANIIDKIMHNEDEYVFPTGIPEGGTAGQMLAMSSNGPVWVDVASPTSITLDTSSIGFSNVGDTYQLSATVSPSSAVITQVYWSSSDETIATVDSTGLVTCVSLGTATITATTFNGLTATCGVIEITWQGDMSNRQLAQTSVGLSGQWRGGVFFNPDGTKIYLTESPGKMIHECYLTHAYDLDDIDFTNSAIYINAAYGTGGRGPEDIHFNPNGTKMYTISEYDNSMCYLREYTLSTAWDISTATLNTTPVMGISNGSACRGLYINPEGTEVFITQHNSTTMYYATLSTPWDFSTLGTVQTVTQNFGGLSIWFGNDGKFVAGQTTEYSSNLYYGDLTTPYDTSTGVDTGTKNIGSRRAGGLWFSDDGTICVMVGGGTGTNYVTKYTL